MAEERHPEPTYKKKYPYNRVRISESGHEDQDDDSPGHTRRRRSHGPSGTYEEWSHDGKWVSVATGNRHHYNKEGYTSTTDKNSDIKHGGSVRENISGGHHSEVKGNKSLAVDGDHKSMVGGNSVHAVKGDYTHGVTGKTTLKLGGEMKIKGDDKKAIKVDGVTTLEFGDTLLISSKKDMTITSETGIMIKVGDSHVHILPDHISIKSGKVYIGGGSEVDVNSGTNLVSPDWVSGGSPPPD
jgi:hypothetical protein